MKKLIIDRIEVGVAVCEDEDGGCLHIPAEKLPAEAKEGDCLIEESGIITIDEEGTAQRKERMRRLLMRAMRKSADKTEE